MYTNKPLKRSPKYLDILHIQIRKDLITKILVDLKVLTIKEIIKRLFSLI